MPKTKKNSSKPRRFEPAYRYPETITAEALEALPVARCPVPVTLIETRLDARKAVMRLRRAAYIGIDTETRPSFSANARHEVSLLQLATEKEVFLFRLNKIGLTRSLISLLENEKIVKVGLSLRDDLAGLKRLKGYTPASCVELQKLCGAYGIRELGLQKIYAIVCGERMSKRQRMTNWEAETLTPEQQHYAALDAWASLRILSVLLDQPTPSPILFAFL